MASSRTVYIKQRYFLVTCNREILFLLNGLLCVKIDCRFTNAFLLQMLVVIAIMGGSAAPALTLPWHDTASGLDSFRLNNLGYDSFTRL